MGEADKGRPRGSQNARALPSRATVRDIDVREIEVLTLGFRPFFLAAGVAAIASMVMWLLVLEGHVAAPELLEPVLWHQHEMLYGMVLAAIAGFLLTAVPNWTGRLPVRGVPLAAFAGLWLTARLAMALAGLLDPWMVALAALAFPIALLAAVGREVVAGRNWRNLKVVAVLAVLAACDAAVMAEPLGLGPPLAAPALTLALMTVVLLIGLIGGRIVPSFTRNWLAKRARPSCRRPFPRLTVSQWGHWRSPQSFRWRRRTMGSRPPRPSWRAASTWSGCHGGGA